MAPTQSSELPEEHWLKILNKFLEFPDYETASEATSQLSCMGWEVALSRDEDGGTNSRYKSPDGSVEFDSMAEVCIYLINLHSLGGITEYSSPEKEEGSKMVCHLKPELCPSAIIEWHRLVSGDKRQAPRSSSMKAKQHLLAVGWNLRNVIKNKAKQKKEMRYISPKGRSFNSLIQACLEEIEIMKGDGSTSQQPTTASRGMQFQVHNRSQAGHQLLSQNVQNTIVKAEVQSSASLPPALPSVTQNSAGQRINMQSGTAQNSVGNSWYASHGMQSQVHNQRQSEISLHNRSQAGHQLLSQNAQNTIVKAEVQSSASLPPALPSVTSLNQTSIQNSAGQRINMQSGTAQNFVGNSVSQGVPSNIFSKTQGKLRTSSNSAQKPVSAKQQIQQPGGRPLSMQPQQQLKQQEQQLKQPDNQKDE